MGCNQSMTEEERANLQKNKEINDLLEKNAQIEANKIKLLLLGAGESGKSTIFKQMKVIYGKTFTDEERQQQLPTIYSNILTAMKTLCEQVVAFNMVSKIECPRAFDMIRGLDENSSINVEVGDAVKALWHDPGMQLVWDRRSEFQVIESVQYYFNRIDIIKMPDYLPDKDDILYSRVRTSGIVTESYDIDGSTFEMYDVGGQRNERKKWIHCFEDVTAIIFVAALSEYDQKLFEDATANRMVSYIDLILLNL
jgi:GTPase SAR1 family protein